MIPLLLGLHLAIAVAAIAHLLLTYRRQAAAVAWIFGLLVLPLIGPLCYVMLAVPSGRRALRVRRQAAGIRDAVDRAASTRSQEPEGSALAPLLERAYAFPLTADNEVELVGEPRRAFDEQIAAIRQASREVLLATYVLKPGRTCDELVDALADRAAAGVVVRLTFDAIGSHELPNETVAMMRKRGIDAHTFMSPNPLKGRLQINFRNHRKILVVDGELAYTGGRNWSDEYYPFTDDAEVFRDTTARIRGPVVADIRRIFLEDWALATDDEKPLRERGTAPQPAVAAGHARVRALPFGPDEPRSSVVDVFGGAFRNAKTSIFVATPYFVPGATLQHALRAAALAGVEVELLMPRACGKRSIDLCGRNYLEPLLEAGVRVFLREPPLMHAKAVVVDGSWVSFGSVNLDQRSIHLNFELNIEVRGEDFARQLKEFFAADLERSELLDPDEFGQRGRWQRIQERAAALFEPLM